MKKDIEYSRKVSRTMTAGFLKILITKLADEDRPFDMKVRRKERGIWEVGVYTNADNYDYFNNLLNSTAV